MGNSCTTMPHGDGSERQPGQQDECLHHEGEGQLATAKPRERTVGAGGPVTRVPTSPARSNNSHSAGSSCNGARNALLPARLIGSNFASTVAAPGAPLLSSSPCEAQPVALEDSPPAASGLSRTGTPMTSIGSRRSSAMSMEPPLPRVTFTAHALVVACHEGDGTADLSAQSTSPSSSPSMMTGMAQAQNTNGVASANATCTLLEAKLVSAGNVSLVPLHSSGSHSEQRAKASPSPSRRRLQPVIYS